MKTEIRAVLRLLTPPIFIELMRYFNRGKMFELPIEFKTLPFSQHGLFKLIRDFEFETVLDVGSGAGEHANILQKHGKKVVALDFGNSIYAKMEADNTYVTKINANFYDVEFDSQFDCIWASHVLEHQPNPGLFIRRCCDLVKENGIIAITVPPLKNEVVGGHLTLWNAGLLLYQLVFNGLDCHDAAICTYGYNITVIVKNRKRPNVELTWDSGDINLLKQFFPGNIDEPFDGRIQKWNW